MFFDFCFAFSESADGKMFHKILWILFQRISITFESPHILFDPFADECLQAFNYSNKYKQEWILRNSFQAFST